MLFPLPEAPWYKQIKRAVYVQGGHCWGGNMPQGDSGYSVEPHLMTPHGQPANAAEEIFINSVKKHVSWLSRQLAFGRHDLSVYIRQSKLQPYICWPPPPPIKLLNKVIQNLLKTVNTMAIKSVCAVRDECFLQGWLCWRSDSKPQPFAHKQLKTYQAQSVKTWTKGKNIKNLPLHVEFIIGVSLSIFVGSNVEVKTPVMKGLGTLIFNWTALSHRGRGAGIVMPTEET
ncbi:hypothetical protein GWK47_046191 [Chionoecetes opilio]|uniref:Uncharacterized protein n=1 Tax=Chionoecetes opilio TaxID=41210 RepID=A0A8J4Y7J3_CHIOP|nr:hypothetical protein GWK47_046191 [Chionoecetes opilio]